MYEVSFENPKSPLSSFKRILSDASRLDLSVACACVKVSKIVIDKSWSAPRIRSAHNLFYVPDETLFSYVPDEIFSFVPNGIYCKGWLSPIRIFDHGISGESPFQDGQYRSQLHRYSRRST